MEAMQTITGKRTRKAAPWIVMALCLFLVNGLVGHAEFTPVFAQATEKNVIRDGKVSIDVSNAGDGYVMIRHSGSSKRLKLRIYYGDAYQTYDINNKGDYEAFPLIKGSGTYKVVMFENVKNSEYTQLCAKSFKADLKDEKAAFLAPNQNAWYTSSSATVAKSFELTSGMRDEWERLETIYNYVSKNIMYDYMKALSVRNPYYPDVDATLASRMGICFDYAAVLACMLRVQGIPTQLVVGDLIPQNQRHAWNKVYIGGTWLPMDATFPNGTYKQSDYSDLFYY